MEIYINGRFLLQPITGVQRFAREIILEIDKYIENNKYYKVNLLVPKGSRVTESYRNISIKEMGNLNGHLWEQIELPIYTKGKFLINLCNIGPALKFNQYVVIHDAAVFSNSDTYSFLFKAWYKVLYRLIAKFSSKVLTVSNFSKKELSEILNIEYDNIDIISEGNEHMSRVEANYSILDNYKLNKDSYILAVSSMNPNKNFQSIIKASEFLNNNNVKIVIAGGNNNKVFKDLDIDLDSDSFIRVGYVTDGELKALYENAICFVFPSFYEGFGLPPLEAMACGCPVIVSNTASMPEVGGDAALYIDPKNPREIAEKIDILIKDSELRMELRRRNILRCQMFNWKKGALQLLNSINEVEK